MDTDVDQAMAEQPAFVNKGSPDQIQAQGGQTDTIVLDAIQLIQEPKNGAKSATAEKGLSVCSNCGRVGDSPRPPQRHPKTREDLCTACYLFIHRYNKDRPKSYELKRLAKALSLPVVGGKRKYEVSSRMYNTKDEELSDDLYEDPSETSEESEDEYRPGEVYNPIMVHSCSHCGATTPTSGVTRYWPKAPNSQGRWCIACIGYWKKNGQKRPSSLFFRTRAKRSRSQPVSVRRILPVKETKTCSKCKCAESGSPRGKWFYDPVIRKDVCISFPLLQNRSKRKQTTVVEPGLREARISVYSEPEPLPRTSPPPPNPATGDLQDSEPPAPREEEESNIPRNDAPDAQLHPASPQSIPVPSEPEAEEQSELYTAPDDPLPDISTPRNQTPTEQKCRWRVESTRANEDTSTPTKQTVVLKTKQANLLRSAPQQPFNEIRNHNGSSERPRILQMPPSSSPQFPSHPDMGGRMQRTTPKDEIPLDPFEMAYRKEDAGQNMAHASLLRDPINVSDVISNLDSEILSIKDIILMASEADSILTDAALKLLDALERQALMVKRRYLPVEEKLVGPQTPLTPGRKKVLLEANLKSCLAALMSD